MEYRGWLIPSVIPSLDSGHGIKQPFPRVLSPHLLVLEFFAQQMMPEYLGPVLELMQEVVPSQAVWL